jgi:hypothetical protein
MSRRSRRVGSPSAAHQLGINEPGQPANVKSSAIIVFDEMSARQSNVRCRARATALRIRDYVVASINAPLASRDWNSPLP